MELWSGVLSNNATKVRIALAEKGLDATVHNLDWTRANAWGEKPSAFLEVSPRGEVPVLIDDGLVIHDSTVINEYLEERYPTPALMPQDVRSRTLCRLWEDEADHLANTANATLIAKVFVGGNPEDPEAADARAQLDHWQARLSRQLGDGDYVCGAFSLADIASFMTLAVALTLGASEGPANVRTWYERMLTRPAIKQEYDAMMSAAAAA